MFNTILKQILLTAIMAIPTLASAVNFTNKHYEGIAKLPGNPLDYWVTLELDDEDAEYNIGNIYNFMGAYTSTGSGSKATLSIKVPGSPNSILKTTDGGLSLEGSVQTTGKQMAVWVLQIPGKLKKAQQTDDELFSILSSPDGYTSFMRLEKQGALFSVTSEFSFTPQGSFSLQCDAPSVQDMFSNLESGSFSIDEGQVKLTTKNGVSLTGTIYDNGNYIMIPIGSKDGMGMTLILIR